MAVNIRSDYALTRTTIGCLTRYALFLPYIIIRAILYSKKSIIAKTVTKVIAYYLLYFKLASRFIQILIGKTPIFLDIIQA